MCAKYDTSAFNGFEVMDI